MIDLAGNSGRGIILRIAGHVPRRWMAGVVMIGIMTCSAVAATAQGTSPSDGPTHLGILFTSGMFTDIAESDANAALIAWADGLTREQRWKVDVRTEVVDTIPQLLEAWESGGFDFITVTLNEYLGAGLDKEPFTLITGSVGDRFDVEYVLLVHQDSGVKDLAGLSGRTLVMHENSRTGLAEPWLDTLLLQAGLPPTRRHFSIFTEVRRLSGVVLPVFFRKVDACLLTRFGYQIMVEMNPQIGRQLRILATSPSLVPSLSCIKTDPDGMVNGRDFVGEVLSLHASPYGKQILTLFQIDRLVTLSRSDLHSGLALVASHRRLLQESGHGRHSASPTSGPARTSAGSGISAKTLMGNAR